MHSFQGTLTFQGEPVAKMMVSFFPVDGDSNPASSGVTNEQGQFKLKVGKTMGVAPGEYIVLTQLGLWAENLRLILAISHSSKNMGIPKSLSYASP